jgi:hypothetical protein
MEGYCKIWGSITDSSLWRRESKDTKLLFVTMLAMSDQTGYVGSSLPGLADRAGLTLEETTTALNVLSSPDLYSRDPAHRGRRVKKVHRGWQVLNFQKFRDGEMARELRRDNNTERQRKLRAKRIAAGLTAHGKPRAASRNGASPSVTPGNDSDAPRNAGVTPGNGCHTANDHKPLSDNNRVAPVSRDLSRQAEAKAEADADAIALACNATTAAPSPAFALALADASTDLEARRQAGLRALNQTEQHIDRYADVMRAFGKLGIKGRHVEKIARNPDVTANLIQEHWDNIVARNDSRNPASTLLDRLGHKSKKRSA